MGEFNPCTLCVTTLIVVCICGVLAIEQRWGAIRGQINTYPIVCGEAQVPRRPIRVLGYQYTTLESFPPVDF